MAHVKSAGADASQLDVLCRRLAGFVFNCQSQEINTESSDKLHSGPRAGRISLQDGGYLSAWRDCVIVAEDLTIGAVRRTGVEVDLVQFNSVVRGLGVTTATT